MGGIVFKFFGIATIVVCILYMAASAFRRSRRLDARIREFRNEQDELRRRGIHRDPYASLAELYEERENGKRKRGGSSKS